MLNTALDSATCNHIPSSDTIARVLDVANGMNYTTHVIKNTNSYIL